MTNRGVFAWALVSAGLMLIGAFGPWVRALGASVGGTDGSNDGWLVVGAALIGALLVFARRETKASGVWAMIAGVVGAAVTIYDRMNVSSAISEGGTFAQSLVQVGWGLNLAMIASISLAISGLGSFARFNDSPSERAVDLSDNSAVARAEASAAVRAVPAGWYQDPHDPSMLRYWTGSDWTTQTATPAS